MFEENVTEPLRLFIAIRLPDAVKSELSAVQEQLCRVAEPAAIRWTNREQLHLTLKFLGNIPLARKGELEAALERSCTGFGVIRLRADGVGFFPNARMPRVVWAGVTDAKGTLIRLQSAVEQATAPFTSETPQKEFTGHVTLGRIKQISKSEMAKLVQAASQLSEIAFGDWDVETIDIMRSELFSQGPQHSKVATISTR